MTVKTLASQIAKLEGKKSQARIGEIREIISILSDLIWNEEGDYSEVVACLYINGEKRANKKLKAKKVKPCKKRRKS